MIRLLILVAVMALPDPTEIATINKLKKSAKEAYVSENYGTAINNYRYLIDSLDVDEDEIFLNLGHAYYKQNDTTNAKNFYARATMSSKPEIKSIAYQQLGVMAKSPQTLPQSLQYLKSAIKADPTNNDARYDYELVKKLLKEQEKQKQDQEQDQQQENEDQEQQDQKDQQQQNQDQQENDQEGEQNEQQAQEQEQGENEQDPEKQEQQQEQEGEQQDENSEENQEMSTKEKLEQMNISEEKARMILEAMRNSEIQYLQQQKRKATERPKSGKPDW